MTLNDPKKDDPKTKARGRRGLALIEYCSVERGWHNIVQYCWRIGGYCTPKFKEGHNSSGPLRPSKHAQIIVAAIFIDIGERYILRYLIPLIIVRI